MKIRIHKRDDVYVAEIDELPGYPPTGEGETKEKAVARLFYNITHPDVKERWLCLLGLYETFEVVYEIERSSSEKSKDIS